MDAREIAVNNNPSKIENKTAHIFAQCARPRELYSNTGPNKQIKNIPQQPE